MTTTAVADLVKSLDQGHGYYTDESDLGQYSTAQQAVAEKMTHLVKGAGYTYTDKAYQPDMTPGANQPLTDPDKVFTKAMKAGRAWNTAITEGCRTPDKVIKSFNSEFSSQFGAFMAANPQAAMWSQWTAQLQQQLNSVLGKNITLTTPLATGFVPFNLVAPSRLIYPVYSPFRNKIPRTQGQGTSYRAKIVTGISGSQTGSSGGNFVDTAIPELVSGGGSMSNWPLNLPASGNQDSVDIIVPYKFLGLSENVSWLAQFSGQGFEDVSALANLILLQEMMLNDEAQILAATSTALSTPSAPTCTARTPNAGETALSGTITNNTVDIKVTAANWYGETTPSAVTAVTGVVTATDVIDVTITPVSGALWYNIYVTVGTVAGTYHRMVTGVGGLTYTLQGAVPTTGTGIPASDTGTYSTYRFEGLIPVLSGHSQGGSNVYPSGWQGGYIDQSVGDTLNINVVNAALGGLYYGTGGYKADPAELVGNGADIQNLSNDIVQAGNATNYRLFVTQTDTPGVRAGAAVSEFVNPVTRSIVRIMVHPWQPQGTVLYMSYNLPMSFSNVSNVWEMNMVQDYLSIGWPVIDATFRYSVFEYGALAANAPFYCGIQQGIQLTDRSGSTGTWS
jgi:hypothetical protein